MCEFESKQSLAFGFPALTRAQGSVYYPHHTYMGMQRFQGGSYYSYQHSLESSGGYRQRQPSAGAFGSHSIVPPPRVGSYPFHVGAFPHMGFAPTNVTRREMVERLRVMAEEPPMLSQNCRIGKRPLEIASDDVTAGVVSVVHPPPPPQPELSKWEALLMLTAKDLESSEAGSSITSSITTTAIATSSNAPSSFVGKRYGTYSALPPKKRFKKAISTDSFEIPYNSAQHHDSNGADDLSEPSSWSETSPSSSPSHTPATSPVRTVARGTSKAPKQTCRTTSVARPKKDSLRGRSSFRGVCITREGKWRSVIYVERKQRYLGVFDEEITAAKAYDYAALQYFGANAKLNIPENPSSECDDGGNTSSASGVGVCRKGYNVKPRGPAAAKPTTELLAPALVNSRLVGRRTSRFDRPATRVSHSSDSDSDSDYSG